MRVPYFTAKDKDSDLYVTGFYAEFPEYSDESRTSRIIPVIMVVVIDTNTPQIPMMGMMGEEAQKQMQEALGKRNTLNFCTIDISTLRQIGEIEIGEPTYNPTTYIKNSHSQIIL